ncbi:ATP-binding protein [uncultured Lamprocystis sp.]|jgi:two-component system sensor histidine kinase HupT/HoxJ|uniref:PAS domain-containing sensor histidine kinase n=1 Tax=uncultured Lamprocystis sp. TaxID=543132 RepID=UPI0025D657C4|nr:ATP-binding protein [uncultured Lamprocystis sp.]
MTPKADADASTAPTTAVRHEEAAGEALWIEVIRKMDETYADLVRHQVELEEKNTALEDAQQFIASVLAAMTDVLIVCDVDGRIQQVNAALETLVGVPEAQLHGRTFLSLLAAESLPLARTFGEKIRSKAIHDCELILAGRDGQPAPLAMNCTSRYDHRGRLVGMVLIGRPVGELRQAYENLNRAHADLKQAQQQLISAEKMASLGRLVAGVAHELNNPISFVYGNIHALARYRERLGRFITGAEAAGLSPELRDLWDELRIGRILTDLDPLLKGTLEGAERVRDLVQDLRRFSSGAQGEYTDFDLTHVVRTAVHWVSRSGAKDAGRQTQAITLDLPTHLSVRGHPGQIHQVVMNLVQNALDAVRGRPEPRIGVDLTTSGAMAVLRVHDNGPGVSDTDRRRVFDPFFTTKPVGQGTGLGLSISLRIVTDHGGTLVLEPTAAGGAVFRMELPTGITASAGPRRPWSD